MASFWEIVDQVLWQSDVVLLLLDARLTKETVNREIEEKAKSLGKPLIYVITKCDLMEKVVVERCKKQFRPSVFVSAKKRFGTTILRERIIIESKRAGHDKKTIRVGVLGYPNVGKSSLINAMKGRKSAPVSPMGGYTKGVQRVRADSRILFLDTPGVLPHWERDDVKHALIGTHDFTKVRDPDLAAMELMKKFPKKIESFYGVRISRDLEKSIERIALKRNMLMKGGKPDTMRMARTMLKEWQEGRMEK